MRALSALSSWARQDRTVDLPFSGFDHPERTGQPSALVGWLLMVLGALGIVVTAQWEIRRSRNGKPVVIDMTLFRRISMAFGVAISDRSRLW